MWLPWDSSFAYWKIVLFRNQHLSYIYFSGIHWEPVISRHLGYSIRQSLHPLELIFLQEKQTLNNPSNAVLSPFALFLTQSLYITLFVLLSSYYYLKSFLFFWSICLLSVSSYPSMKLQESRGLVCLSCCWISRIVFG